MSGDVAVDLYCGLGGWTEGLLAEGFTCYGFDIERHDYGTGGYLGRLTLQDVRTLHGSQFRSIADRLRVIVASPPCQKYSYMAMPWKRAKALAAWYREDPARQVELNELFNACFRIQREASEACGRHIPLIVENVKGAQPWIGKAQAHFGSFYLWGDVGMVGRRVVAGPLRVGTYVAPQSRAQKVPGFRFDGSGGSFQTAAVKVSGQNWRESHKRGEVSPCWTDQAIKNNGGSWFAVAHNTESGKLKNPVHEGAKGHGSWFGNYQEMKAAGRGAMNRQTSSNSIARKAASAQIAKIPFPLARHIAKCFASKNRA